MCAHLYQVEVYLKEQGVSETFRGQSWSANCREWIYYDCVLKPEALITKFVLPSFIVIHENNDLKSGTELGLVCTQCNDGIMGKHPVNNIVGDKRVIG